MNKKHQFVHCGRILGYFERYRTNSGYAWRFNYINSFRGFGVHNLILKKLNKLNGVKS